MYILNPDALSQDKIYYCNGIIANWLIYTKHLPLLCKKDRKFGFAITNSLKEAILELPFWLKINKCF